MPSIVLKWDGVKLAGTKDSQSADVTYIVMDADDEPEAISYALANAPTTYNSIPLTDIATADRLSESAWLVSVKFSTKLADQTKDAKTAGGAEPVVGVNYEIEFEATAGTVHLTRSLSTKQVVMITDEIGDPAAVPTEVDFNGNINDTGDAVEGCDFPPEADFKWSETHYIKTESVNDEYIRTLEEMAGKVNDETFRNREPGCVLFRGVSGKRKDTTSYAFTFRFESKRPLVNANLPSDDVPSFAGVNADGYDFVWFRRVPVKDENGKRIIQRAVQCNVEEVAVRGDFSELGIGVSGLDA